MKLEHRFETNWESINYLEERCCEPIWELLYQNQDKLPKHAKVKVILDFEETK
jgi:hypothetical protein